MPFTYSTACTCSSGLLQELFSHVGEDVVAGHASDVIHVLCVEVIEYLWTGKTTVETNPNAHPGECCPQPGQGAIEDAEQAGTGTPVTGFEHAGEHELFTLVIELQETQ